MYERQEPGLRVDAQRQVASPVCIVDVRRRAHYDADLPISPASCIYDIDEPHHLPVPFIDMESSDCRTICENFPFAIHFLCKFLTVPLPICMIRTIICQASGAFPPIPRVIFASYNLFYLRGPTHEA